MKAHVRSLVIAWIMILSFAEIHGQVNKITVMHNGNPTFYNNLSTAVTASSSGDTIYLPGGGINPTSLVTVNKRLTIVGAGHYPDSTLATNPSIISGIAFLTGADDGSISGCKLNSIQLGTSSSNNTVNNFRIERCHILSINLSTGNSQNVILRENILDVGYYISGSIPNPLFEKNIFNYTVQYPSPAIFNNNIFYTTTSYNEFDFGTNSVFNNNIIINTTSGTLQLGSNCIYNNNLFCTTAASGGNYICGSTNVCNNNISGQLAINTFVDATTNNFSYSNNYHLKPTSPGVNAGTDGTDVGIFGTIYPYKDGAIPFNPHISSKTIGTNVTPEGNLPVDIKVSAQDR